MTTDNSMLAMAKTELEFLGHSLPATSMAEVLKSKLEPTKEAILATRNQPGRPPKEVLLKDLQKRFNLTRAQAKEHLRKINRASALQWDEIQRGDKKVEAVSPLVLEVNRATRYLGS